MRVRPSAATADAIYDQIAAPPGRAAVPAAGAGRAVRRSRCWRRPTTRATTWPTHAALAARPDLGAAGDPDVSARPLPRGRTGRLAGARRAGSAAAADVDTGHYARLPRRARAPAPLLHRPRRDLGRPRPRRRRHRAAADPTRPRGSIAAALTGDVTAAEATAFRRHMIFEMARMSVEDGLVMTLHPGVRRGHHRPTAAALRTRHRPRHPDPGRVHRRAAAAARAVRHPSRTSTWCCSPSTSRPSRASSPRWPASTRACTSARPGGSSTRPTRSAATGRPSPRPPASAGRPASSTTPAPSARSRPGTTCAGASTPATSPAWSPSTASTRTRPSRPPIDLVTRPTASGVQAVSVAALRRAAPGSAGADRAPRSGQLLPGPPGRATPTSRRTQGEWGIAAFAGRSGDLARRLAGQDGLYTLVTRGPEADEFSLVASVVQAHAGADDEAWLARLRDPALACVTVTVTEYGYRDGPADGAGSPPGSTRAGARAAARWRSCRATTCSATGPSRAELVLESAHRIDPALAGLDRRTGQLSQHHGRPDHPAADAGSDRARGRAARAATTTARS